MNTSPSPLIDTHCHFDVADFDMDRAEVAARAVDAGVEAIVIPGYLASEWPTLFRVCASLKAPRLLPAPGLHPCYVETHEPSHLDELERLLQQAPGIVAVGEIGLDHFVDALKAPELKERQRYFFRAQLALAQQHHLPVILHVRKAHADVLQILREMKFRGGGIVHAWSGGIEEARQYVKLGFRLGIGGALTYDQSRRLRDVVRQMPLDALVLETDAPDMIAAMHRLPGKGRTRNSPEFLPSVAAELAVLKGVSLDTVYKVMHEQSMRVLRLDGHAGVRGEER